MPLAENAPSGVCLNQWALYYADYSKFWFDRPHREQQHETTTAMNISECLIRLAEMQAEFGDTEVALETCIDAARETHLLRDGESDFSYLEQLSVRMQALVARSTHPVSIRADAFELDYHRVRPWTDRTLRVALLVVWSGDVAGTHRLIEKIRTERGNSYRSHDQARIWAELAVLFARSGETDNYRTARRTSLCFIEGRNTAEATRLLLAEADALAGEFPLAPKNLVRGSLMWYGDADRPRSALAIQLAKAGRWQDASEHFEEVTDPWWRLPVADAVAQARSAAGDESPEDLLNWALEQKSLVNRVGALCGLALAQDSR